MKKQKIAFCIPDMIIGGVESVFITILTELIKSPNLEISVFLHSKLTEPFYHDWFTKHPEIQIKVIYPLQTYFERLKKHTNFFPLKNIRKLIFSIYKKYKRLTFQISDIDIYIDYKNASFHKELRRISKPKITWCHGSFEFFQDAKLIKRLQYYDKMIVLTNEFKTEFNLHYPELQHKIIHLSNPIDQDYIIDQAKNAPTYSGKYFCSVSRLGTPKDISTIINAFSIFWELENQPDVKLLIIGDGPNRKKLEVLANHSAAKKHIIFMGTQTNPFGYMRNAMAHILSSTNEGFGMVLLESATVGTLNVSSNHKNGAMEILQNGQSGLLFPVGDLNSLAHIMCDIFNNRIPRTKIIKQCQDSLHRFDIKSISTEIITLLQKI